MGLALSKARRKAVQSINFHRTQVADAGLLKRYEGNPVLTAADFPRPVNSVFNAGAARYGKDYLLLSRVEDLSGSSLLWVARSADGLSFVPHPAPALVPSSQAPYDAVEESGIEDPRVTCLEGSYYITYVGFSRYGAVPLLARTEDFEHYERVSILGLPDNKDVVLFPERIGGKYAKLDRPTSMLSAGADVWISFSTDLVHWGGFRPVMRPRPRKWDGAKIGPGAPPIRTPEGWLLLYHGVRSTSAGALYRLGAVLLDLEEPWKVIGRAPEAILSPQAPEDFQGNVPNVVFTCGAVAEQDGTLKVYYGAADQVVCLATAQLGDIVALCRAGSSGHAQDGLLE